MSWLRCSECETVGKYTWTEIDVDRDCSTISGPETTSAPRTCTEIAGPWQAAAGRDSEPNPLDLPIASGNAQDALLSGVAMALLSKEQPKTRDLSEATCKYLAGNLNLSRCACKYLTK